MTAPVKIMATLTARPGKAGQLKALLHGMVPHCRAEPGNLRPHSGNALAESAGIRNHVNGECSNGSRHFTSLGISSGPGARLLQPSISAACPSVPYRRQA